MDTSSLALLYRAPDSVEAALLKQALEEQGIPTVPVGGATRAAFGDLGIDALLVELWVPRDQLERGREVIEGVQRLHAEREVAPRGAWACPKCGESNEASFELCWNCGTARSER